MGSLSLLPAAATKTLSFVRHGEGTHNVAGAIDPSFYKHEKYFDAHLTAVGWAQAQALRGHVQQHGLNQRLQLIVVSPLTRAIETAVAAFGGDSPAPPGAPLLMAARPAVPEVCPAHPGTAAGVVPFVACELCREHLGVHPCDRRRPLSHYREAFPAVDWSHITQEQDELWTAHTRESDEDLAHRSGLFLQWLMARPEQHIAVVTHSSWLSIMFKHFAASDESLTRWFENAEMRTIVLHAPAAELPRVPAAVLNFIPSVSTGGLHMHATESRRSEPSMEEEEKAKAKAPAGAL